jgi:predicted nucleic acid-binding protein
MEGKKEEPRVIIDTNKIISALLAKDKSYYKLILSNQVKFYFPEFGLREIEKYKEMIISKRNKEKYKDRVKLCIKPTLRKY